MSSTSPGFLHFHVSSLVSKHLSVQISKPPNSPIPLANLIESLHLSSRKLYRARHVQSVIVLFKNFGFTETQIAYIFTKCPRFLTSNPNKTLKPKLDFLSQNGLSGILLAQVVSARPVILTLSLENQIRPCFTFLNRFFSSSSEIVALLLKNQGTRIVHSFSQFVEPNVDTLRRFGVPDSNIVKIIWKQPMKIARREASEFSEIVRRVKKMGFHPESMKFVHGLGTVVGMTEDRWVEKVDLFKSFGWSEEEFLLLLLKQPKVLRTSVERLKNALDFFINTLEWTTADVSKYRSLLFCNFDKRIMARFPVIQFLITNGLMRKKTIGSAFLMTDDDFLKSCVLNYQDKAPQILGLYQSKKDKATVNSRLHSKTETSI